jgi:hypothetical protein
MSTRRHVAAVAGLVEESFPHQLFEQHHEFAIIASAVSTDPRAHEAGAISDQHVASSAPSRPRP